MSYKLSRELIGHTQDVKCVHFINSNTLLSGARDNSAILWRNVDNNWAVAARVHTHDNYVNSVGYLADNGLFIVKSLCISYIHPQTSSLQVVKTSLSTYTK